MQMYRRAEQSHWLRSSAFTSSASPAAPPISLKNTEYRTRKQLFLTSLFSPVTMIKNMKGCSVMSAKKYISLFFVLVLMLCILPLGSAAADMTAGDVQAALAELPDPDTLKTMSAEQQRLVYDQTQAAYDGYLALPDEERSGLEGAEETFRELFDHFNTLVMPLEETAPAEEPAGEKAGIPWHYTALILALITTVLQRKFIFDRR